LCYLWRLPDGEYVGLFARQSSAQEKQLSSQAIERTVVRWDAQGTPLPYTVAEFEINVANGLQTDKVTVACVVGN
jgi:hypothetical protein